MPKPLACAFLNERGQVTYTGIHEGPYKRLKELSLDGRRGAGLDLVSTEQAEAFADELVAAALAAAADVIAANASACEDHIQGLLLRSNEKAVRELIPAKKGAQP